MTGRFHPRYADVVGTFALLVAMSGTAYAVHALPRHSVGTAQLERGAVKSAKIKNGQVKAVDVADGSLTTVDVADGSLTTVDVADGSLPSADVADHSLLLADLVRVDTTVLVSVVVNGDSCQTLDLAVPGAEVGQAVILVPAQTVPAVFPPPRVSAPGAVSTRICAVGLGAVLSNSPFRVLT